MSAESDRVAGFGRLEDGLRQASDWYLWGPYVSERQWGTVREDYSADGEAWDYLPHDHARSRAYRWGEDGLAGFCDIEQRLCLGLALWNGRDPILKERAFGLTGAEGNHGEDVKEYWWYLDAVPSHAWNRWRYHYPQVAFPYEDLAAENGRRGKHDPEYELLDTGVFDDDRYWITEVHYAKAGPTDLLMTVSVTNAGPEADTLHVLPTAWFRNTWSWDAGCAQAGARARAGDGRGSRSSTRSSARWNCSPARARTAPSPVLLFCENETNIGAAVRGAADDAIPQGRHQRPRGQRRGHRQPRSSGAPSARFWYRLTVAPGETAELRLRLRPAGGRPAARGRRARRRLRAGRPAAAGRGGRVLRRADPAGGQRGRGDGDAAGLRRACCGASSSTTTTWPAGSTATPPSRPPPPARRSGRNARWRNFDAFDIMSMPDKWEYPWFAAWDLAFHCVSAGPRRPGVRQVPADPAVPGVVPAPRTGRCPPTSGTSAT